MDYHTPPAYQKQPSSQQPMNQPQVIVSRQPSRPQMGVQRQSAPQMSVPQTGGGIVSFPPPELSGVNTAKSRLEAFKLETENMEKSIRSMLDRIKGMSDFYTQFTKDIIDPWFSAAPSKVRAADEILKFNSPEFTSCLDKLTNQLGPSFFDILKKHNSTLKELWELKRKCTEALINYQRKEAEYKQEYSSSSSCLYKVDQDKEAYIKARQYLDEINSNFISQVYKLDVGRQTDLTNAFKSFFAMFCQFINKAASLKPIDFPSDPKDYLVELAPPYVPPPLPKRSSDATIEQQPSQDLDPNQTSQIQTPSSPNTNLTSSNNQS